ncbi:hypothetical protein PsorP6_001588 [Peronosclerospora sorghi]|uniref:Uncharacterized protein n=1 Tax=Peronosclerospora sorghi TaxID=230839 RepID=A0ACC0WQM7_9STRA|nr:hypothetical protein PsorP6_001588 [Peronosclerospora sorghi]
MFVEDVSAAATATIKQIEKDDTLVSQQLQAIVDLQTFYKDYINANGPLASGKSKDIDIERDAVSRNDLYLSRVADMTTFLEYMDGFVSDGMQHAERAHMENLARNLSKGLLNLIADLDKVVAERNSLNGVSLDVWPPVLPHELVTLNVQATMVYIETKFGDIKNAYHDEKPFRNALDGCTYQTPFTKAWKLTKVDSRIWRCFAVDWQAHFPERTL